MISVSIGKAITSKNSDRVLASQAFPPRVSLNIGVVERMLETVFGSEI